MLVRRHIEAEVRDSLSVSRATALVGPRQAGKSTLAQQIHHRSGGGGSLVTLDDPLQLAAAREDPVGYVDSLARPTVIDEIQRAPELLLAIKMVVDQDPTPGQFLLTGSANITALPTVPDALPGRVEYLRLWPFSQDEIAGRPSAFIDRVFEGSAPPAPDGVVPGRRGLAGPVLGGGYPGAQNLDARQRARFFASYVETLLGRDLPSVGSIRVDPARITQLVALLAARTGGEVNHERLGTELGLDGKTVRAHIELLERLFLVHRLPPWSRNLGSRVVKRPKLHLADSGLVAALLRTDADAFLDPTSGADAGGLLETFVATEVTRLATWSDVRPRLFHYRDAAQREIDIVLEAPRGDVVGIEVKAATSVSPAAFRSLAYLRDQVGDAFRCGVVLHAGHRVVPFGDRLYAAPVSSLWAAG